MVFVLVFIQIYLMKDHARISSPDPLVTFKIWKRVEPTMTKRNTPSRMGPTLLDYYFF